MALSTIQASYNDDDTDEDEINTKTTDDEDTNDRMAVMNDPAFSVMSKIKLNLTPAIAIQVREIMKDYFILEIFRRRKA
jgi:hypothetical protein